MVQTEGNGTSRSDRINKEVVDVIEEIAGENIQALKDALELIAEAGQGIQGSKTERALLSVVATLAAASDEANQAARALAIYLHDAGTSPTKIAASIGVSVTTIHRWTPTGERGRD